MYRATNHSSTKILLQIFKRQPKNLNVSTTTFEKDTETKIKTVGNATERERETLHNCKMISMTI